MTHNEDKNQLIETDLKISYCNYILFVQEGRGMSHEMCQKDPNQVLILENYNVLDKHYTP